MRRSPATRPAMRHRLIALAPQDPRRLVPGSLGPNRATRMARSARRPRTADGDPSGLLRNVPPPQVGGPAQAEGPERAGKGAETTQPASRMNRPARTLTWDLVRRRHPTGASPSRRNAPGRTLSPMPSEQKGAYGGHLALSVRIQGEQAWNHPAHVMTLEGTSDVSTSGLSP